MWRRLEVPAAKSLDDLAELQQVSELAERNCVVGAVSARRCAGGMSIAPIGPCGRNERPAAVWQNDENEQHAALLHAANDRQRLAFEGMALPDDRHLTWVIAAMGSLWMLPSGPFPMPIC